MAFVNDGISELCEIILCNEQYLCVRFSGHFFHERVEFGLVTPFKSIDGAK
jgi:hypothetical protein